MNRITAGRLIQKSDIDKQLEPNLSYYKSGHIYWIGNFTNMGKPIVEIYYKNEFIDVDPRRILWAIKYGYYPSKTCIFIRRKICKKALNCVNPEHYKLIDF